MERSKKTESTDLVITLPKQMTPEYFADDKEFEKILKKIEDTANTLVPDLSTKAGRDEIKSMAYKIARTKATIDKHGLALTEGWRNQIAKVNEARGKFKERLEALQKGVRAPLTEWEDAEKARVDGHEARLQEITDLVSVTFGLSSAEYEDMLEKAKAVNPVEEEWDEFYPKAQVAKLQAIQNLERLVTHAKKQEADAAELEALRAAQAERDRIDGQRDYARRLIKHCEQCSFGMIDGKAYPYAILFRELEEKLVVDDACGDMAEDVEKARQDALECLKAAKAEDDARHKEKAAQEAREVAEREAKEKIEDAERQKQEAEEKAARAVADERKRIADEKAREDAEREKREADLKHRRRINRSAMMALMSEASITEDQATDIVKAIVAGKVPNVTLSY